MTITSSFNVVVRVDGLLSVAINRSARNRIGLGKKIKSTQQEIVALNSKQNTPEQLLRTNLKHKRRRQIIFDAFYMI